LFQLNHIYQAFSLLTRLPIPEPKFSTASPAAEAGWAYPVVGIFLALLASVIGFSLTFLGFDSGIVAGAVVVSIIFFTGGMHEDGLADSADGFWGSWEPARRLEIMKDSHIGTFGVIALFFSLLLRWYCIKISIDGSFFFTSLIIATTLSRSAIPVIMSILPNAREDGLSAKTGQPSHITTLVAIAIGVSITLLFSGWVGLIIITVFFLTLCIAMLLSRSKIGGQTGDTIGASQQLAELSIFSCLIIAF
jgi:adenosylcobinamide-GDP ribazoletransferase